MGDPKGLLVVTIGFGPTDLLRSLELDTDDNLKVVFAAAAQGLVGTHGWIGGAWQKNPIELGYSADATFQLSNLALAAGTNNIDSSAVPAGELWYLPNIAITYVGTPPTLIRATVIKSGVGYTLLEQRTIVSNQWYSVPNVLLMKPGDTLRWHAEGCTLNDDGYLNAIGWRVDIDQ